MLTTQAYKSVGKHSLNMSPSIRPRFFDAFEVRILPVCLAKEELFRHQGVEECHKGKHDTSMTKQPYPSRTGSVFWRICSASSFVSLPENVSFRNSVSPGWTSTPSSTFSDGSRYSEYTRYSDSRESGLPFRSSIRSATHERRGRTSLHKRDRNKTTPLLKLQCISMKADVREASWPLNPGAPLGAHPNLEIWL